jgi:hypothetical protein
MEPASGAFHRVFIGQILLVVCCVVYLIWRSVSFRPGQEVNRVGGVRGILLLVTAASGLTGVYLSVMGMNALPSGKAKLSGPGICLAGILLYVVMLFVTSKFFQRPVTTELFLITGFLVLELTLVNALNASGLLTDGRFVALFAENLAAFAAGMVLYVLYYRVEPVRAFYLAMVPLAVDGISVLLLILLALV